MIGPKLKVIAVWIGRRRVYQYLMGNKGSSSYIVSTHSGPGVYLAEKLRCRQTPHVRVASIALISFGFGAVPNSSGPTSLTPNEPGSSYLCGPFQS